VYKEKTVAVAVGCVVDKPAPVVPLNQQTGADGWGAMAPGSKAEAVRAPAGRRLNYEDRLTSSVKGCPDAPLDGSTVPVPSSGSKLAAGQSPT